MYAVHDMNGLTDVPGILVGHVSDYVGLTRCTAILCVAGGLGGADMRGAATGNQEFDLFNPPHLKLAANKPAQLSSVGVAPSISPSLGVAAAESVARSIVRAVELAPTPGGLPGLKG